MEKKGKEIISYIQTHPLSSSKEIFEGLNGNISYATVKRRLSELLAKQYITQNGGGKSSRYSVSPAYSLLFPINLEEYYKKEIDERSILSGYNFSLIPDILSKVSLFTQEELNELNTYQQQFTNNITNLTPM